MQIALETKLGKCALDIKADLRNDNDALKMVGENALNYLIWHVVPGSAYDKKSAFKRNSDYSEELKKHIEATTKTILAKCFDNVVIGITKALDPAEKILAGIEKISDEDWAKMVAKREAMKTQPKTEAVSKKLEAA